MEKDTGCDRKYTGRPLNRNYTGVKSDVSNESTQTKNDRASGSNDTSQNSKDTGSGGDDSSQKRSDTGSSGNDSSRYTPSRSTKNTGCFRNKRGTHEFDAVINDSSQSRNDTGLGEIDSSRNRHDTCLGGTDSSYILYSRVAVQNRSRTGTNGDEIDANANGTCLNTDIAGPNALDERTIIMVGITGNGKSSLGNTLLGGDEFQTNDELFHETTYCEMKESISGSPGIRLKIVDTPGLFNNDMRIEETALLVQGSLELIPQPNLFLIVFRCSGRLTDRDKMSLIWLKSIFGDKAIQHTLLVFTHGAKYLTDNAFRADLLKAWPEMSGIPTDQIYIIENIAPNQPERTARLLDKIRDMSQPYDCDRTIAKTVLEKYCKTVESATDLITRTADIHRDIQNEERKAPRIKLLKYAAGAALLCGAVVSRLIR